MATEKADVVIVGVGASGGIIAAELAKAGMKVIGLERGPKLSTANFQSLDELRYFQRQETRPHPKKQPVTWRANASGRATPIASQNNGNQAGGGTVHYGTLSWRFHEDDFRVRSHNTERYGASAIPEDSSVIDWPIGYADLEPYYDRAEYELGVSGKAGNIGGKKIEGGNVFEAPRKRDYPMPALFVDQAGKIFEEGAKKLGYHPFASPRAITPGNNAHNVKLSPTSAACTTTRNAFNASAPTTQPPMNATSAAVHSPIAKNQPVTTPIRRATAIQHGTATAPVAIIQPSVNWPAC